MGGGHCCDTVRTAGLLGEGQRITHAKLFKRAKKFLGIRSVRNGFGDAGEWLWRLERQPASPVSKPLAQPPLSIEDTYAEALDPEEVPADVRARRIPSSWIDGVARLDHHRPFTDIYAALLRKPFVSSNRDGIHQLSLATVMGRCGD